MTPDSLGGVMTLKAVADGSRLAVRSGRVSCDETSELERLIKDIAFRCEKCFSLESTKYTLGSPHSKISRIEG